MHLDVHKRRPGVSGRYDIGLVVYGVCLRYISYPDLLVTLASLCLNTPLRCAAPLGEGPVGGCPAAILASAECHVSHMYSNEDWAESNTTASSYQAEAEWIVKPDLQYTHAWDDIRPRQPPER